jgi:hypothetical protein
MALMVLEYVRQAARAVGAAVVLLGGYGVLQPLPQTHIVGTVNAAEVRTPPGSPAAAPGFQRMTLSLVVRCSAGASKACTSTLYEMWVPGLEQPIVKGADDLEKNLQEVRTTGTDPQGRQWFVYRVLRPLRGGETLTLNVLINGKVDHSDLRLLTVLRENLIAEKFDCGTPAQGAAQPVSNFICSETFGVLERIATLIPFLSQ